MPDGTELAYLVDGRNRRIGKQINGTTVQKFLYQDQLNPVAELDANGNIISQVVWAPPTVILPIPSHRLRSPSP